MTFIIKIVISVNHHMIALNIPITTVIHKNKFTATPLSVIFFYCMKVAVRERDISENARPFICVYTHIP